MKHKLLVTAALCLFLTACGTDAGTSPTMQPDQQITEQTATATSTCRAIITEISGNTLTVTPVVDSWELNSSDKFTISAEQLDATITPTIGMTLEITYDGSILETYPASFSGIQKVTVVSEAPIVSDAPVSSSDTLMNDLEYEIAAGDTYATQYKQQGYYINVVDNKYQYIICSGEHSTGGYGIEIKRIDTLDIGKVIVTVEESSPAPDEVVTEAFTYPNCAITFSYEPPAGIKIQDAKGTEYECLGTLSPSIDDLKSSQRAELRRAIMVDGTMYLDTGYVSSMLRCGNLDGNIEKVISENEIPDEDGEANFSAEGWQRGFEEDTLDVLIDNEFCIFGAYGTEKAKEGYIPQGVMQFLATVDEVTDDGFVIVKTDTQPEHFPQIRKDTRYRISMDSYDPGIYNGDLAPGNVVIVICKGRFEGDDPVTITDVYSFSLVGSNVCQPYDGSVL